VGFLKSAVPSLDAQVITFAVLVLVLNLLIILWAVARLSREVRLLRTKADMIEHDINLLDQSISDLSTQFQAIRHIDQKADAGKRPETDKPPG